MADDDKYGLFEDLEDDDPLADMLAESEAAKKSKADEINTLSDAIVIKGDIVATKKAQMAMQNTVMEFLKEHPEAQERADLLMLELKHMPIDFDKDPSGYARVREAWKTVEAQENTGVFQDKTEKAEKSWENEYMQTRQNRQAKIKNYYGE